MREIIFYRTESGKCPVEEFLDSLPAKEAQKVTWVLKIIEELPRVPRQYFKKLSNTDDIWEVRISVGLIFYSKARKKQILAKKFNDFRECFWEPELM